MMEQAVREEASALVEEVAALMEDEDQDGRWIGFCLGKASRLLCTL
jgi:hypothetical protein